MTIHFHLEIYVFSGWGGEDDDFSQNRLRARGFEIARLDHSVSRYQMLGHRQEARSSVNEDMFEMKSSVIDHDDKDGLASLKYTVVRSKAEPLYYHLVAEL